MNLSAQKAWTLWLLAMVALFTVAGFGERLLSAFGSAYNPDRLAAISAVFSGVPSDATPITLIAVDEKTQENWGRMAATPHDALALLVGKIATLQPKAILLDFDLSAEQAPEAKLAFQTLLQNYAHAAPLLLVRRVQFTKTADGMTAQAVARTPYDNLTGSERQISWVTTLNDYSQSRMVQGVRLWQSICGDSLRMILPSAPLAISGLDRGPGEVDEFLTDQVAADCSGALKVNQPWPKHRAQSTAIPYLFGQLNGVVGDYKIANANGSTPAVIQLPAYAMVTKQGAGFTAMADVHPAPFVGRVVLIGATHADNSDIYQTPLGPMPGVVILANSIVSANAIVNTPSASLFQKNILSAMMIIFFVGINRWFVGVVAATLMLCGVAGFLFLTARFLGFSSGVESIAVGISGFALFKFFDGFTQLIAHWPKLGWRTIFK